MILDLSQYRALPVFAESRFYSSTGRCSVASTFSQSEIASMAVRDIELSRNAFEKKNLEFHEKSNVK